MLRARAKFRILEKEKIRKDNDYRASMRGKFAYTCKYGMDPPRMLPNFKWRAKQKSCKALEHPDWDHRFGVDEDSVGVASKSSGWPSLELNYRLEDEMRAAELDFPMPRLPDYQ